MGMLIITIIAFVLGYYDIITTNAVMFILFGSLAWMYIAAGLYFKFGFLKFFYHDLLGWHMPDDSPQWFDGLSDHAHCKYCGEDIMQDSQGNWF